MSDEVQEKLKKAISENKVLIFMKGTRHFPQCGFSAATVDAFNKLGVPYETIDVLADTNVREGVKQLSNWPTIPQVFVDGKFIGGCDIVLEMHQKGDLETLVKAVLEAA